MQLSPLRILAGSALLGAWSLGLTALVQAFPQSALLVGPLFTASLAFLSYLLAYVHGCIHNPQGRWIERQGWFMWLDRHHYIHHVDQTANINFLLPLCDLLFGTRKAQMSPEEASHNPSFEEAKPLAWDVRMAARP